MPDGSRPAAFDAVFSDFKLVKTRSAAQLVFEVPIERADAVLAILGGVPQPGKEVSVAVARLMGNDSPVPLRDTEAQRVDQGSPPAEGDCPVCHLAPGDRAMMKRCQMVGCPEKSAPAEGRGPPDAPGDGVASDTQADRSLKSTSASARGRAGYIADDEGGRARVRAVRMCKSASGQEFLLVHPKAPPQMNGADTPEDQAAEVMRHILGIKSRREISTNERALKGFLDLEWQMQHEWIPS